MRRILWCTILLCILCTSVVAHAQGLAFGQVPDVIRPGKAYAFVLHVQNTTTATFSLLDEAGVEHDTLLSGYPLAQGENALFWDGMTPEQNPMAAGNYTLRLVAVDGTTADAPVRIGAPYPLLTHVMQAEIDLEDTPVEIAYVASEAGTLNLVARPTMGGDSILVMEHDIAPGEGTLAWDGTEWGNRLPVGAWTLTLTLENASGAQSMPHALYFEILPLEADDEPSSSFVDLSPTPAPTADPTATSAPYSQIGEGTFWNISPGELSDAVLWEMMMQPITVYDGKLAQTGHVYLMENPDGTGKQVAQIHGQSQGIHVIGKPNEHGYVLCEAFSNYDRTYTPKTDEEREAAYDLKQGYLKAANLKTVNVKQDKALLIDKKSQRLYIFLDGVRVTELLVATGLVTKKEDTLFETIPGEYITASWSGGFWSGNMFCDQAIRINGGILLHEVPYKVNKDGTKNYSAFEAYLGTKQSHGCVRIQRLKSPEGYNHAWLWSNLKKDTKVIIWDDRNRVDTPTTWVENPKK